MKKQEFINEVKKVNFDTLKKRDKLLHNSLKEFTLAVYPELFDKKEYKGKLKHTGEFPVEVQDTIALLFKQMKSEMPDVFKENKPKTQEPKKKELSPIEKKLKAFELALKVTDNEEDKNILKKKINAFRLALAVTKGSGKLADGGTMQVYTIKNKPHNQDNISFFDVVKNAKKELPSFLDYDEVLKYSLNYNSITDEKNIKSICDGGDHLEPYFSENNAAYECDIYLSTHPLVKINEDGEEIKKYLKFDKEVYVYELF